mmetsp:Transcript_45140/g.84245  ORF Transcript_45140/g.84245 Transcript_45140/m.84245 type:complete len:162 (+) Transcript_45140:42-527(+)
MDPAEDWTERNRKQGFGFNYDAEPRRRPRRSRTPNRAAGEEQRRKQREKRKALFAAPTHQEPKKEADTEAHSPSDDEEVSTLVSAPKENAWERASWEKSSFETSSEKTKFLRLMGAEKGTKEQSAAEDSKKAATGSSTQDLERQYWQGMQKQLYSRGRGLG